MTKLLGKEAIGKITGVSQLNFSPDVRVGMYLPKQVVVNDLTLREGRQIEGISLTVDECVRIAQELQDLGVPMIQIANWSEEDRPLLKALGKLGLKMRTECMTAAHQTPPFTREALKQATNRALDNNLGVVPCLALSNDILLAMGKARGQGDKSLEYLKKQEIDIAVEIVSYVKSQGGMIDVNLQDFLRCDWDHAQNFCQALVDAKVDVIILDDISGPAMPAAYKYGVHKVKQMVPEATLGIHVHNDFGLALPAVLAAFEGGCEVLTCGINGYGERAGHADLSSVVACLEFLYGYDTSVHTEKLVDAATLISDIMGKPIPKATPIVGAHAFSHIYDWHWEFSDFPWAVASLAPEAVGNVTKVILGEGSGPYGIQFKGKELGIDIPVEKVGAIRKVMAERMKWSKRAPTDDEFRRIVKNII
ncbi:hypothetical protein ACFLTW_00895 [Chloroflexota bacterium]